MVIMNNAEAVVTTNDLTVDGSSKPDDNKVVSREISTNVNLVKTANRYVWAFDSR